MHARSRRRSCIQTREQDSHAVPHGRLRALWHAIVVGMLLPGQTLATASFGSHSTRRTMPQSTTATGTPRADAARHARPGLRGRRYLGCHGGWRPDGGTPTQHSTLVHDARPCPAPGPVPSRGVRNVCNVVLMRLNELKRASPSRVLTAQCSATRSRRAAGVAETALTRIVLPLPILVVPAVIMAGPRAHALDADRPPRRTDRHPDRRLHAAFAFALPLAISLFPQQGSSRLRGLSQASRPQLRPHWQVRKRPCTTKGCSIPPPPSCTNHRAKNTPPRQGRTCPRCGTPRTVGTSRQTPPPGTASD